MTRLASYPWSLAHVRATVPVVMSAGMLAGCGGGFGSAHACIPSFGAGHGTIVQCADGMWSHSGGRSGACSDHGGER
jgi:hypothetical protein